MSLTIVGLGPGDGRLLTRQAWQVLEAADPLYLRTAQHPAVADLPQTVQWTSFDSVYESAATFEAVYQHIITELLDAARSGQDVIYAVPGDPSVGESTVAGLSEAARKEDIPLRLVPGVSFVEPVLAAVSHDALDGLQLFDALDIVRYHHPPLNPDVPLLLGQVHSRSIASELKLALMAVYPENHQVALVHGAGSDAETLRELPLYAIDRDSSIAHLTSLYVPPLPYKASLTALAETVAILRAPGGCPWDQEQTPQSMRPGFLEEAYEVLEALDLDDPDALREELGDLLYHIVMQVQMAREQELFTLSDVIAGIETKLKRRHPHVWGDWEVSDSAEVRRNWEVIKQTEKGPESERSLLDNIPQALPALVRSQKIQEHVRRVGFDWTDITGPEDKIAEELAEVKAAASPEERRAELGDLLFVVVNYARWLDIDAETALRQANERFRARFRLMELLARERGLDLASLGIDGLEALWQEAKALAANSQPSEEE